MKKQIISCIILPVTVMLLGGCTKIETVPAQALEQEKTESTTDENPGGSDIDGDNGGSVTEGSSQTEETGTETQTKADETTETEMIIPEDDKEEVSMKDPVLLYMGHASLRIVTEEDKVIYIDPFCGEGYDLSADMILQTHDHFDHKDLSKISKRNDDCVVITQKEALAGGTHQKFDTEYVQIEAVEAGNNQNHSVKSCVGYILTFGNGVSLYVSGDTSKTQQMAELADRDLDYAFYCCDGVYNMGVAEAAECAELVGAKVNIPYHTGSASVTLFDKDNAQKFDAPGAYILMPGSELVLEKK